MTKIGSSCLSSALGAHLRSYCGKVILEGVVTDGVPRSNQKVEVLCLIKSCPSSVSLLSPFLLSVV